MSWLEKAKELLDPENIQQPEATPSIASIGDTITTQKAMYTVYKITDTYTYATKYFTPESFPGAGFVTTNKNLKDSVESGEWSLSSK